MQYTNISLYVTASVATMGDTCSSYILLRLQVGSRDKKKWYSKDYVLQVDFVAVSGSVSAESLRTAISIPGLKILSKIDGISCLKKADEIIAGCDGIIVARDSLGDSIGAHKVIK